MKMNIHLPINDLLLILKQYYFYTQQNKIFLSVSFILYNLLKELGFIRVDMLHSNPEEIIQSGFNRNFFLCVC